MAVMSKQPPITGDNVVPLPPPMPAKTAETQDSPADGLVAAGGPNDPRMKEAMRLMQAFLAIEDAAGRTALITLAERLVSDVWLRRVQGR